MPPEKWFSRDIIIKGISQMGITYFAMFIASILAGILIFLMKNFLESALLGNRDDRLEPDHLRELFRKNEIECSQTEAYIQNHMVSLEQARCEKERRRNRGEALI
jgi:hypothetical protein